jgi:hypothetical protein
MILRGFEWNVLSVKMCSAPLGLDNWQSESQKVYYDQERGTIWHNDDDLQPSLRHKWSSSY